MACNGGHCQHGATRNMEQALRDAPKQQAGEGGMTSRTDDDQIGSDLTCCVGDHVRCVRRGTARELEGRVDSVFLELLNLPFYLRLDLFLVGENRMTRRSSEEQLLAVNNDEPTIGPTSQLLGIWQCAIRCL